MLDTLKRRERLCELVGLDYFLNPCARLDAQLHPGINQYVGSSIEDKYSVTQSPPGYYNYAKCWDVRPVSRADLRKADKSPKTLTGVSRYRVSDF